MVVIFVGFEENEQSYYRNILKPISSENEISFYNKPEDAFQAFNNFIIPYQSHVDLIISRFSLKGDESVNFFNFFRNSVDTYSYYNFKLSSIPLVIIESDDDRDEQTLYSTEDLIHKPDDDSAGEFIEMVKDNVKKWRRLIYDDLEILGLGLDYNFDRIDIGYTVRVKLHQTEILSESFVLKQANLPYLWLSKDFFEIESSIDELESLVNNYLDMPREQLERIQWEEQLQDFFNRNPKFLFQNDFSNYWSQPKIKIPNSRLSYKPDFIMKPEINPQLSKNWEIIDLKLPVQEFMQQTHFHPTFTAKFFKCLRQIKNYKKFFMDESNKESIEKVLKFHPKHPKMTLVVGKRNLLFESQDKLFENLNDFNLSDVYLLSYDEIIDNKKRHLERLLEGRIF